MSISAKEVMALRQKTGLGMMDCKQALIEADGDANAAEEILRATRKKEMDNRTERPASHGRLALVMKDDHSAAAVIEVNTETDFTARNDIVSEAADKIAQIAINSPAGPITANAEIEKIVDDLRITTGENISYRRGIKIEGPYCGHYLHHDHLKAVLVVLSDKADEEISTGICQHITAHVPHPVAVDQDGLPQEMLDKVRSEAEAEVADSNKPANIIEKIIEGKVRKFVGEMTLMNQKYVKDPDGKKTVGEILPEGVKPLEFHRYVVGLD